MLRFLPSGFLFGLCLASGLCASFYGKEISTAASAKEALPFAPAFALFSVSAGASFALSAASLADASRKSRKPSL